MPASDIPSTTSVSALVNQQDAQVATLAARINVGRRVRASDAAASPEALRLTASICHNVVAGCSGCSAAAASLIQSRHPLPTQRPQR